MSACHVCASHTNPSGRGLRGSREIPVSNNSSWLSGEMCVWLCVSRRSCRECKLSSASKLKECSWADVMSNTWITLEREKVQSTRISVIPSRYIYKTIKTLNKYGWRWNKDKHGSYYSPSCWEYSVEHCSTVAGLCQDPNPHHVLQSPTVTASAVETQLAPAAA